MEYRGRCYTVYTSTVRVRDTALYVLYYVDNTHLKEIAEEYALSRPAVMMVYIDNVEEVMQDIRDSERAQITGRVETILEDWVGATSGILRKYGSDRFMVLLEERHLEQMVAGRFDILDRVRSIQTSERISVTLSIGVGQGKPCGIRSDGQTGHRNGARPRRRPGGGQNQKRLRFLRRRLQRVEKRTKVRTRVVASALQELIEGSENVLVMGHRFSDLDCLGSAGGHGGGGAQPGPARVCGDPAG